MANKNTATHIGECQVCGRIQKLPKGQLSKHGYTKQWGFFNGTCWGAEHLPFEQSIDLIEGAIKQANEQCAKLAVESESLKAGTFFAGPTIWTSVTSGLRLKCQKRTGLTHMRDSLEATQLFT